MVMIVKRRYLPFAGIGSRKLPEDMAARIVKVGTWLNAKGFLLRSGHAEGSDETWESVFTDKSEIFAPWRGFNQWQGYVHPIPEAAYVMAAKHHPVFDRLSRGAKTLMARNCQQILGPNLDHPSLFVLCYTADGCESHRTRTSKTGGTGLAISLASNLGIPIFNLQNDDALERFKQFILKLDLTADHVLA